MGDEPKEYFWELWYFSWKCPPQTVSLVLFMDACHELAYNSKCCLPSFVSLSSCTVLLNKWAYFWEKKHSLQQLHSKKRWWAYFWGLLFFWGWGYFERLWYVPFFTAIYMQSTKLPYPSSIKFGALQNVHLRKRYVQSKQIDSYCCSRQALENP